MNNAENFSRCLVDGDPESLDCARRLRNKALVISLFLEAGLLTTMLLWPLITPGVLARQFNVTPAPPFHGGGNSAPRQPHEPMHPPPKPGSHPPVCLICAPPAIPPHPSYGSGPEPPNVEAGPSVVRPTDQPHQSSPLSKSEGVMEAMLVHRVQPEYSLLARASHISGTVQLRAIIARDGTVRELQVVSGNPLLAQAARVAVLKWRYRPTLLNGEPVEVETYITVNFVLE
jgi:TonB family protein